MRGSRFLQGLANAVLDKTLPRMRRWLEERFGPQAELSQLRVEGERVILEGARLPLGPLIVLRVERAAFALEPSRRRFSLTALKGALAVEGDGDDHVTAPIELVATTATDDAWVAGTLQVSGATWRQTVGEGSHHPLSGTVQVFVNLARWELFDGHFESAESQVWLSASGPMESSAGGGLDEASFVFREARAGHLVDGLTALAAQPLERPVPLPRAARLTGEIRWKQGVVEIESSVVTAASRLELALAVEGTALREGSLRGEVALADLRQVGVPEGVAGRARGDLTATGAWPELRVEGPIAIDHLEASGLTLDHVQAHLTHAQGAVRLREARGEVCGAVVRGEARIPIGGEESWVASVSVVGAEAPFVAAVAKVGGLPLEAAGDGAAPAGVRWLPPGLTVTGEVTVSGDGEVAATLALEAEATALVLKVMADETLRGSLRGRLDTSWFRRVGWIQGPVGLAGILHVDGTLEGTPAAPELAARLSAKWVMLRGWDSDGRESWRVPLEELGTDLQLDRDGFGLSRLRADLLGGDLRGSWIHRQDDVRAQIVLQDVHVGAVELPAQQQRLAGHVAGTASGWLELFRGPDGVEGNAEVTLDRPMYRFLALAAPRLKEAGLAPPPPTGHGTARALVAIEPDAIRLRRLDMPIVGAPLRAEGILHGPGGIDVTGTVHLQEDYLRTSLLLAVPSVFSGSVDVPFHVHGQAPNVTVDADPKGAFREAIARGPAGAAVTDAFDGIRRAVGDLSGMFTGREAEPPPDPELEALVDRILADDPDTDHLIDRLLDAGVTSEEIVRVLERRRIRMDD